MFGHRRAVFVLATVPYLLLSGSQSASVHTRVYLNGTIERTLEVAADPSREREIVRWLRDSDIAVGASGARRQGGSVVIRRSHITPSPASLGQGIRLQISEVMQRPLTLFTYYQWDEQLYIEPSPATHVELAGQRQAALQYEIELPGSVLPQTVSPAGQASGGRVSWTLPASSAMVRVQATSRAFRWGYLLILLYILGFIGYRFGLYVDRLVGYRPRRI